MDKPITHRLLELVTHTVPTYGHARLCSEMVLEHSHQQFKHWLTKNTHGDVHISAMEKVMARDWLWRLSSLYSIWLETKRDGNKEKQECAERGLRRILLGEGGVCIDSVSFYGRKFLEDVRRALIDAMKPPVPDLLLDAVQDNSPLLGAGKYEWSAWRKVERMYGEEMDEMLSGISSSYPDGMTTPADLDFYERARFMQRSGMGRQRSYRHNVVRVGHAISAVVREDGTGPEDGEVQVVTDGSGSCRFYSVHGIVAAEHLEVWMIVKEIKLRVEDGSYSAEGNPLQYVKVLPCVRRVAVVHVCTDDCKTQASSGRVMHSVIPVTDGRVHILSRADGYPPFWGEPVVRGGRPARNGLLRRRPTASERRRACGRVRKGVNSYAVACARMGRARGATVEAEVSANVEAEVSAYDSAYVYASYESTDADEMARTVGRTTRVGWCAEFVVCAHTMTAAPHRDVARHGGIGRTVRATLTG